VNPMLCSSIDPKQSIKPNVHLPEKLACVQMDWQISPVHPVASVFLHRGVVLEQLNEMNVGWKLISMSTRLCSPIILWIKKKCPILVNPILCLASM